MKNFKGNKGFTLIELLLVVVIIGLMLAVIVPRAWRANVDTKYGLVRQNCSELASFGMEWAESMVLAQNETDDIIVKDYLDTLTSGLSGAWVADFGNANWCVDPAATVPMATQAITGRTPQANPETSVAGIIAPEKIPRNPFNGAAVFVPTNDAGSSGVTPGAIACSSVAETSAGAYTYYAFLFQGTDSLNTTMNDDRCFYAGQVSGSVPGLRNGVFFARIR